MLFKKFNIVKYYFDSYLAKKFIQTNLTPYLFLFFYLKTK